MLYRYLLYLKFMKSEFESLCGYSKRKGYSKLTEKTILLIKKVYDSKLLEKLMIGCGWRVSLDTIKLIYNSLIVKMFFSTFIHRIRV